MYLSCKNQSRSFVACDRSLDPNTMAASNVGSRPFPKGCFIGCRNSACAPWPGPFFASGIWAI